MGLLDLLPPGAHTPFVKALQRPLNDIGHGLVKGKTWQKGLAEAADYSERQAPYRAQETERQRLIAETEQSKNQTIQAMLEAGREDLANMAEAGYMGEAWQGYLQHKQQEMKVGQGGDVNYGVNPVYGRLEDGTMGMGVIGDNGTLKRIEDPGFQPLGPYDTNALKAAGTAFGKGTGQAQFDVPAAELTMHETLGAINDIRANEKGMEEQFGNILGLPQQMTPAWPGSEKANFQNAVSRGADQAFLQAREMLRGGGQITDFEGRKAENAITNMTLAMERGDKKAFQAALDDFEQAVRDGYAKLLEQAATMPSYGGGQAAPQGGSDLKTKYGLE